MSNLTLNPVQAKNFIANCKKVYDKKSVIPEWENVYFQDGKMKLFYNDGFLSVDIDHNLNGGYYFEQFEKFAGTRKDDIYISDTDIVSGKSKLNIPFVDRYDPKESEPEIFAFSCEFNSDKIKDYLGIISTDELRISMTGIYFDAKNGAIVGTDAHLLIKRDHKIEESFIMPTTACKLIASLKNIDVMVCVSKRSVQITWMQDGLKYTFMSMAIDARYPDWLSVIPVNDIPVTFDKKEMIEAIKDVLPFTSSYTNRVEFNFEKKFVIGQDIDFSSEMKVDISSMVGNFQNMGFNGKMMLKVLSIVFNIEMKVSTPNRAALFMENETDFVLIMPIMLS